MYVLYVLLIHTCCTCVVLVVVAWQLPLFLARILLQFRLLYYGRAMLLHTYTVMNQSEQEITRLIEELEEEAMRSADAG
jgi:cell division protein FtsB